MPASEAGILKAILNRWFRNAGGMPRSTPKPARAVPSFSEREEIAILGEESGSPRHCP